MDLLCNICHCFTFCWYRYHSFCLRVCSHKNEWQHFELLNILTSFLCRSILSHLSVVLNFQYMIHFIYLWDSILTKILRGLAKPKERLFWLYVGTKSQKYSCFHRNSLLRCFCLSKCWTKQQCCWLPRVNWGSDSYHMKIIFFIAQDGARDKLWCALCPAQNSANWNSACIVDKLRYTSVNATAVWFTTI